MRVPVRHPELLALSVRKRDKVLDHLRVFGLDRLEPRRRPPAVAHSRVGLSSFDEHLDEGELAVGGGDVEGPAAVVVAWF